MIARMSRQRIALALSSAPRAARCFATVATATKASTLTTT
jgi:hypothetical protein